MGGIAAAAVALLGISVASSAQGGEPTKTPTSLGAAIDGVRGQIRDVERELVQSEIDQSSASSQLRKIRKLLALQKKEIELSKKRIDEIEGGLASLAESEKKLRQQIHERKAEIRKTLATLERGAATVSIDARWVGSVDADLQKSYFLAKTIQAGMKKIDDLGLEVRKTDELQAATVEERSKLESYVQELQTEIAMMSANEQIQSEILRSNHASKLEALRQARTLKERAHELESKLPKRVVEDPPVAQAELAQGFAKLRGRLPLPIETAQLLSGFGKAYDPKTKLLTFQKGITLGAQEGTLVKSVSNGKVAFAGALKNYGMVVIVEHPGEYFTLYGNLGSVTVSEGQQLDEGAGLGALSAQPLYFEIRNRNVAVNPSGWLTKLASTTRESVGG